MDKKQNGMKKEVSPLTYMGILAITAMIFVLVIGSAIWSSSRDEIVDNQKEQLLDTSTVLAENMEVSLREFDSDLNVLSLVYEKSGFQTEIFREFLQAKGSLETDIFLEEEGDAEPRSVMGTKLVSLIFLTRKNETDSIRMGEGKDGTFYLLFTKTMTDGRSLSLLINEDSYYKQLFSEIRLGTNGYVVVKDSDGTIVMHPEKKQWGIDVIEGRAELYPDVDLTSLQNMIDEQNKGGSGISDYYSYWWTMDPPQRVRKISAYADVKIGDDFWIVSSVQDYDDFYAPVAHGFGRLSILYTGSLLISMLLFVMVGSLLVERHRTMRQIKNLQEVNHRLEVLRGGEARMAHQQRLQVIGTMTGGIAHEFNNLLTPIMGYAELLMMELPKDSDSYTSAAEIYDASDKAKEVVRQISSLSRKNTETVFREIRADWLLTRAYKMMATICPEHIKLEKKIETGEAVILGNASQLEQSLLNMTVNAFHAIGNREDGLLKMEGFLVPSTEAEQDEDMGEGMDPEAKTKVWETYLCIRLTDNGAGMDPDTMKKIFEPFFTTKKEGEGTGLGLALTEQFISAHKGNIKVSSEPGKGTEFRIYLPVSRTGNVGKEEDNKPALSESQGIRIVIADDNDKVLNMLEKQLSDSGLHIVTCRDMPCLQKEITEFPPEVLLVDEQIHDLSGVNICMSLAGANPQMIRIVMTELPDKDILDAARKKIIDDYVIKPVSDVTVMETVRKCLLARLGVPGTEKVNH